jgi:hypothetical protein
VAPERRHPPIDEFAEAASLLKTRPSALCPPRCSSRPPLPRAAAHALGLAVPRLYVTIIQSFQPFLGFHSTRKNVGPRWKKIHSEYESTASSTGKGARVLLTCWSSLCSFCVLAAPPAKTGYAPRAKAALFVHEELKKTPNSRGQSRSTLHN